MLKKLAKKHPEYPGLAVDAGRMNDRIANELGEMRGAADDLVRSLKNLAVLIPIVLPDGREITLYDAEQMDRAIAYTCGGPTVLEPSSETVRARVDALLEDRADQDETALQSAADPTANDTTSIPDIEDAVLCLDAAKRTFTLDGNVVLVDVVVDPLGALKKLYQACAPKDLETILESVRENGFLTLLGDNVYRVTLTPGLVPSNSTDPAMDPIEHELTQYRIHLRQAGDLLEREQARLSGEHAAELKHLKRVHDERIGATCDEVRAQAERTAEERRIGIVGRREEELATLEREYHERRAAIEAETSRDLEHIVDDVAADAEKTLDRIQQEGDASWEAKEMRFQQDVTVKEEIALRSLVLQHEEYDERVSFLEHLLERRLTQHKA
ncbi:hypothetical protein A3E39_04415 [Candidatus Uhrbacteria bacterium RIFCSPHIGHO2_12_FULL_60_25]|uniref:Uncharacterized protein n=1 Tax=Candidatus Uhrbacteria bacterium RIFCSPHIGHO2_12_FULL_60_25 TaxID=1802399 RepID=A0A1F7UIM5_9BACT|nr:MAG: hypothetical protein A3D73_00965 [Candidatus Uhrbacteria bacterium RIFCSPHIGHO2_02_FULL_60_44]OGL78131.1 MAG: hypothetical protein A3E39_04415 [Candidatus Uhrbacteria bacterium RIFCSPHIGHO2_12_FULL_60_25]